MKCFALTLILLLTLGAALAAAQTGIQNKPTAPEPRDKAKQQTTCGDNYTNYLNKNIELDPQNTDLRLYRAVCLAYIDDAEFYKDVLAIIKINPNLTNYIISVLDYSPFNKNSPATFDAYEKMARELPDQWFVYALRAKFNARRKDQSAALENIIKVFEIIPDPGNNAFSALLYGAAVYIDDEFAPQFYDRIFNAGNKRRLELVGRLKTLAPASVEYRETERTKLALDAALLNVCRNWARRGARLGNASMERAALEKISEIDPASRIELWREKYTRENSNSKLTFAGKIEAFKRQIAVFEQESKQPLSLDMQKTLNGYIGDLYLRLGELYFQNQQYVKAIDSFNNAKPFLRDKNFLEMRIYNAVQILNGASPQPK